MTDAVVRVWRRASRRFGLAALLAPALLVTAAAIVWWLPRLHASTEDLRQTVATRQAALARRAATAASRPLSESERLQAFSSAFPPLNQSASDLERVFALAKAHGIDLPKGEYQLKAEGNAPVVSYSVVFPVHNEYGALKGFAADVLQALPHVSMDELRMTRDNASVGALDSVVRFTFTYGRP